MEGQTQEFDYSFVSQAARIALYDDLLSSPRIIEILPAATHEFINNLASSVYNHAHEMGGSIPYTAVKQVTENFIHARFQEVIVSILDSGNTIRFTDQGPGISDKQAAQRPGFSSATEEMKHYIDGVGSGLPIVREYLDVKNGSLMIEDNLNGGSVITLSLLEQKDGEPIKDLSTEDISISSDDRPINPIYTPESDNRRTLRLITASLSKRGKMILPLFLQDGTLGVQEISNLTEIPLSSVHSELKKLEESGLIERLGKKRLLSQLGERVAKSL